MLQLIKQLYDIAKKESLKLAAQKSLFMLLTVKTLGHETGFIAIRQIQSKIAAIHKISTQTTKLNW